MKNKSIHIITWREDNLFVSKFLELELASQGKTKQESIKNLQEALDLYLEGEDTTKINFPAINDISTQTFSFT